MYIYKLTNTVNGKAYIGCTVRPIERRLLNHWSDARNGKQTLIAQAIREFGKDSFTVEVITRCASEDEMVVKESEAISSYGTLHPDGYNFTSTPGLWGPGRGFLKSVRDKISASSKGKEISPEHRKKISETQKGRIPWNLGVNTGPAWNRGIPHTEEQRAKMKASRNSRPDPIARAVECDGVIYPSVAEAARVLGLCRATMKYRLRNGKAKYVEVPEGGYQDKPLPERRNETCPRCGGLYSQFPSGARYCKPCRNAKLSEAQRKRRALKKQQLPDVQADLGTNPVKELST